MPAIAAVFTIGHVANMLGEDEEWLHELSIDLSPDDGCLYIYGVGNDGVTAFTESASSACGRSSPTKEGPEERRRRLSRRNSLPCGPHRMLTIDVARHHSEKLAHDIEAERCAE